MNHCNDSSNTTQHEFFHLESRDSLKRSTTSEISDPYRVGCGVKLYSFTHSLQWSNESDKSINDKVNK